MQPLLQMRSELKVRFTSLSAMQDFYHFAPLVFIHAMGWCLVFRYFKHSVPTNAQGDHRLTVKSSEMSEAVGSGIEKSPFLSKAES